MSDERPELTWRDQGRALEEIGGGKSPDSLDRDTIMSLILCGLIESHEQQKPCRACGQPVHDYRYWHITAAGRVLLAAYCDAAAPVPA